MCYVYVCGSTFTFNHFQVTIMECLGKYFVINQVKPKNTNLMMNIDGSEESRFYAVINQSAILDSSKATDSANAKLVYLIKNDTEEHTSQINSNDISSNDPEDMKRDLETTNCNKHFHFELDIRKTEAAKLKLERNILEEEKINKRNIPYSISTYFFALLQKAFKVEYLVNECQHMLDINSKQLTIIGKLGNKINKSIFACSINSLVKSKLTEAQVKTVKLFLPPVYEIPKQFDAKILLAKYLEQFYGSSKQLKTLQDFYLALNFQHINGELPLTTFYEMVKDSETEQRDEIHDKHRFENICNYIIYIYALNHYQFHYDLCRLDREIENLLVTDRIDHTKSLTLLDKTKIYYVPRNSSFYAYKNNQLLKAFTMTSLFCELI